MSSNIPLIKTTENKIKDDIGNLKTDKENIIFIFLKAYKEGYKLTSLDKSRSSSKTETQATVKLDTKKNQCHQPVQIIEI